MQYPIEKGPDEHSDLVRGFAECEGAGFQEMDLRGGHIIAIELGAKRQKSIRPEHYELAGIGAALCGEQDFPHLLDQRRFERFDFRSDLRIENAFAAVATPDIAGVSQDPVARTLGNALIVEPVRHQVSGAVQANVGPAELEQFLEVLPGLAERLGPALCAVLSEVGLPFREKAILPSVQ
jgi:hypothetical protein